MTDERKLLGRVRILIALFMVGLILSGLTAFPLRHELNLLASLLGVQNAPSPEGYTGLKFWILRGREGLLVTDFNYPFIAYGTDWLGFGHLVIALFFIGPLIDPVRNIWVLKMGLVACAAVIPVALICGAIRQIPFYWRLIDCSFGVIGFIPLWISLKLTRQLERERTAGKTT